MSNVKALKNWVKQNLAGKTVFNSSMDEDIELTMRGLKHTISYSNIPEAYKNEKLKSIRDLEKIVAEAKLEGEIPDRKNRRNLKIYRLLGITEVIVRKAENRNLFYNHRLIEKE